MNTIVALTLILNTSLGIGLAQDLPVRPVANYPGTNSIPRSCLRNEFISQAKVEALVIKAARRENPTLAKAIDADWSAILHDLLPTDKFKVWEKKVSASEWLYGVCILRGNDIKSTIFLGTIKEIPTISHDKAREP